MPRLPSEFTRQVGIFPRPDRFLGGYAALISSFLLREAGRLGHDQLFKRVLEKFLKEFLELFFPAVARRLDFGTVTFLDKELPLDFPKGTTRQVDVVARLETHEGEPDIVLVHVEVQSRPERDFARRMFEYSALLWLRDRAPIFPVVLYLQGGKGLTDEEYRLSLFGRELFRFRYATVGLARLRAEEYVGTEPLGVALAALMPGRGTPTRRCSGSRCCGG